MKYQRFDEICVSNVFIFVHIGKRGKLWSSKGGILCCICGQIMGCKRSLRRHLKIHSTGQTRFSCTICHRSYSRKDNMMRHKCAPIKYKRQKQPKSEWAFLEVMSWSFKLIFGSVIRNANNKKQRYWCLFSCFCRTCSYFTKWNKSWKPCCQKTGLYVLYLRAYLLF